MKSLQIQRLRNLVDTGAIPLRPIVLLVGRNSSGKSTFLRTLPLLRQSSEQKTRGPILWYGDYVDFGSFQDAASRHTNEKCISFTFSIEASAKDLWRTARLISRTAFFGGPNQIVRGPTTISAHVDIVPARKETSSTISRLLIELSNNTVALDIDPQTNRANLTINDETVFQHLDIRAEPTQRGILPTVYVQNSNYDTEPGRKRWQPWALAPRLLDSVINHLGGMAHGNVASSTLYEIAEQLAITSPADFPAHLADIKGAPATWYQYATQGRWPQWQIALLQKLVVGMNFPVIVDYVNQYLGDMFSSVRYIKPLRASAERYYRQQDLAVEEIDSSGANVPMYLDSLNSSARHDLSEWLRDSFGFEVRTRKSEGHVAIQIYDASNSDYTNLADMGFGYSQLLPLALQLWAVNRPYSRRRRRFPIGESGPGIVAIEQPELHLHPELQARIGDALAATVRSDTPRYGDTRLLVETHSKHLINRIGSLIADGQIQPKDVGIVLFDQSDRDARVTVRESFFDDEGVLTDWPYGFFEPGL